MIKTSLLCFFVFALTSFAFSQVTPYSVIEIKNTKGRPGIVTARDNIGRTVTFRLIPLPPKIKGEKKTQNSSAPVKVGSEIIVNLATSTAAVKTDPNTEYELDKRAASHAIGTVTSVSPFMVSLGPNGLAAYVKVKLYNGKEGRFDLFPYYPDEQVFGNKLVYEGVYNNKKNAILYPTKAEEMDKLVFSFELLEDAATNPEDSTASTDTSAEQIQKLMENRPWELTADPSLKAGGEMTMDLPKGITYSTHMLFYNSGDRKRSVASWYGNNNANLPAGLYDVVVDGKYTLYSIPIEEGKQTRLKMGFFSVSHYGPVTISNGSNQKFTYAAPFTILLPEGTYFLPGTKLHPITISDREQLRL